MSSTIPTNLEVVYGGIVTTTDVVTRANRGFQAVSVKFPDEGMSTTSNMYLLGGFSPADNASTQTLTMSSVSVNANSGKPMQLAVRPTTANSNLTALNRVTSLDVPVMESMNYDDVNSTGIDRTQYLFSETVLGLYPLTLGGSIPANQAGAYFLDSNGTASGTPTGNLGTNTGLSFTGLPIAFVPANPATDYGSWPVTATIQSLLTNYQAFVLKAGSPVPADGTFNDLNDVPVKLSLLYPGGTFTSDFVVDPTKYMIMQQFSTNNVKFSAGSAIPEGTTVQVGDYVAGTVDISQPGMYFEYALGVYPKYTFELSRGSTIGIATTLYDGFFVPAGTEVPTGSNTNDKYTSPVGDNLVLPYVMARAGFDMGPGFTLHTTVLMDKRAKIPKGVNSTLYQPVPLGMHTKESLVLDGVQFPVGSTLETELTVRTEFELAESITVHQGTMLGAGTYLPKGSATLDGALIDGELLIPLGSAVADDITINTKFVIEDSTVTPAHPLSVGAVLHGPFDFTPGTQITSGNSLPGHLKILMSMGVTLLQNMILAVGTVFGSSALLYGDVGFSPTGVIPALSTLYGTFTLPTGTKLEKDWSAGIQVPIPTGTVLQPGDTLKAGTTFKVGSDLPPIPNLISQAAVAGTFGAGPLTYFIDNGTPYLVIKAGTAFVEGWTFPVGTILSANPTAGATFSLADATSHVPASTATLLLQAGAYTFDDSVQSPSQQEYTYSPGVPSGEMVIMLTDTIAPTDIVIPYNSIDPDSGKWLSMNEPFTLITDVILDQAYTVRGNNSVIWPAGTPTPYDFVLTSPYSFTTSGNGAQISKKIKFNYVTTAPFINGIVAPGGHIKLPPAGYVLTSPIKLGVNQPIANTGANAMKATIELAPGTTLMSLAPITLINNLHSDENFTIGGTITVFPRIYLPNGITLLAGQVTPGDIHITGGQGLPKNIILNQSITLAANHTISEENYTLLKYSLLAPTTVLARGTTFPAGLNIARQVSMGPILSLDGADIFYILEGNPLTASIGYPYFATLTDSLENAFVPVFKFDTRSALTSIEILQQQIQAIELQIANA